MFQKMAGSGEQCWWIGIWYSKQKIKQEKLVFYPQICFHASKLNMLQRGACLCFCTRRGFSMPGSGTLNRSKSTRDKQGELSAEPSAAPGGAQEPTVESLAEPEPLLWPRRVQGPAQLRQVQEAGLN